EIVGALDDVAVGRLSTRLEEAVRRSAAVLAVVDQPNANMAWELGMALAKGLRVALATESESPTAPWVEDTPLGGVLRQKDVVEHARALLCRVADWDPAPKPPQKGDRKLVLCASRGTGKELCRALKKQLVPEGWELVDTRGWTLSGLGELLEDAGRLAWAQLRLRSGEKRHGIDNTIGALVAGYAHARGIAVAAFVDDACPRPVDARELERKHGGSPTDLVQAIRAWSQELDQPAPVRSRALLKTYQAAVIACHQHPLAYVAAFDLSVAELQPVDIDVDVGGPVDGLECRQQGFAERRHGTLQTLLQQDLQAAGAVRWLLQADPGAGKTTLMRRVAHQRASEDALPVFVPLARWAEERGDPVELAARVALDKDQEHLAPRIARAIRRQAKQRGRVWLLLDGFDEVKDYDQMRRDIEDLAAEEQWAQAAIVVTSRAAAVRGGTAWTGFTRASLRLLDISRQRKLVSDLLRAHPGEEGAFWRDIGARPGVGVLLPNPFLLTLTVGLFRQGLDSGAGTPLDRRRLLQRAIKDCLERGWGPQRQAERPDRWSPRYARRVLRGLSLELHRQGKESWERDTLSDVLAEVPRHYPKLAALYGREGHWQSDRVFLDDIGKYGGLLGPLDGPQAPWRYLHRSLREVLAAECLAEELEAPARGDVLTELMAEQGSGGKGGPERSAEVLALLAGMVQEDEAVEHLEELARVAPDAGLRALTSVEGLDPWRWLGLLLDMEPEQQGERFWSARWSNDDLDAILDAIRRDGRNRAARLWQAVTPELPARH
ncbi:MAG: NACHT domain-containing protein, partial [Oligoflexia bacterium]|nr:NACHT domain-containing protein [Oligoflexia bacterium]